MIKEIEINGIMYPVVDRSTLSFDSNGMEQGVEKETVFPEPKQDFNLKTKSLDDINHLDIKKMRLKFFFKSKRESKKIQTFLFKLGFKWSIKNGLDKNGYFYDHGTNSFNTKNGFIYHMSLSDSFFEKLDYKDYTNIALNKKS